MWGIWQYALNWQFYPALTINLSVNHIIFLSLYQPWKLRILPTLVSVRTSKSSKRSLIFLTPHKILFTRLATWQLQQLPKTSPMLPPIQIWRTEAPLKKHSTWKHIQKHTASKEAHWEPAFPFFFQITIHRPSMSKSPSGGGGQNCGKARKPNKICSHQIQLYHCRICEKLLVGSESVHKQFINSRSCEKCFMETRS